MKTSPILLALLLSPAFLHAETNTTASIEEDDGKSWMVSPLVTANPTLGNGLGAVGMYFFDTDPADDISPASIVSAVGLYTDTDSYFAGLFTQTFWNKDTLRVAGGYINGKINNSFNIDGLNDTVDFSTHVNGLFGRVDRRMVGNYFLGVKAAIVDIRYKEGNDLSNIYFERFDVEDNLSGQLGLVGSHDSRDHIRFPEAGNYSELSYTMVPEWLGSEVGYHVTEGFANQYISVFRQHVLALRAYGRFTPSNTPYSGLSTLGRGSDLRGYTSGENVAENLIALQSEYRAMLTKRFGVIGFIGISQLYDGSLTSTDSDTFYPSGGLGLRYMLNTENKMNFRFDYAWGSDDEEGFYVSVGEAF